MIQGTGGFSPLKVKRKCTEKIIQKEDAPFYEVDARNTVSC